LTIGTSMPDDHREGLTRIRDAERRNGHRVRAAARDAPFTENVEAVAETIDDGRHPFDRHVDLNNDA
jgi:hypothetical protein